MIDEVLETTLSNATSTDKKRKRRRKRRRKRKKRRITIKYFLSSGNPGLQGTRYEVQSTIYNINLQSITLATYGYKSCDKHVTLIEYEHYTDGISGMPNHQPRRWMFYFKFFKMSLHLKVQYLK